MLLKYLHWTASLGIHVFTHQKESALHRKKIPHDELSFSSSSAQYRVEHKTTTLRKWKLCRRRRKSFSCVLLRLDKPSSEVFLYHSLRQHCESKSAALREGISSSCLLVLRPTLFHSLRRLLPRDRGSKCKNFFCNRIKFTPRLSPVLFVRQLLRKIKLQCVEKYYLTRHCIITTRLSLLDQEQEKKTGSQTNDERLIDWNLKQTNIELSTLRLSSSQVSTRRWDLSCLRILIRITSYRHFQWNEAQDWKAQMESRWWKSKPGLKLFKSLIPR